jgi:multidrug efflux pump subunit AcrB
MIASYFVSMAVTPVACRYLLKHVHPGPLAQRLENAITGTANGYASLLAKVINYRKLVLGVSAVLVVFSGILAARLPSTFFPEIDESMDTIYVRFSPGISLQDATTSINKMGKVLQHELGDQVELVLTNLGLPGVARSAIYSPNPGPNSGFIQLALSDVEKRKASQQELADQARDILNKNFPGVEFLQSPGGLVASVFSNGYFSPMVLEVRNENLNKLSEQLQDVAGVARTVPGLVDMYPSVEVDYPEVHVDTNRQAASQVNVTARAVAQQTLESTYGNINTPSVWVDEHNGQTYYVVTSYNQITDPSKLMAIPAFMDKAGRAVTLGAYATARRALGPLMVERNSMERAGHMLMQTKGRDIGSAALELEKKLKSDPRTKNLRWRFAGEVELMRKTFSGLGLAISLAIMLVFMIMASQFKSLRLPFVMLFTIPVTLVGIVLALMGAGQGFSITAMMGILMVVGIAVSNGILMVDDSNRRLLEGVPKVQAILDASRSRFVPIAMTSLATIIGLVPTALGIEHGTESNQPLALAVVGGLTSSTILSLFLVPVMFLFFAKEPSEAERSEA